MKETTMGIMVISILVFVLIGGVHCQNTAAEWQSKAIELAAKGNIEAAKLAFDEAISLKPNDGFIPHIAGVTMAAKGDHIKAVGYFNKAVRINPSDDLSLILKGDSLQQLGRYGEAIKAYDKAIGIYSGNPDAWSHKGNALLAQKGNEAEALKAFDASIKINSKDSKVWLNKGVALAALGKYNDAIKAYKQVIKIDPNNADAYNNIGQVYFDQGQYEEALKWFDSAIKTNPDYEPFRISKCETLNNLSVKAGGGEWFRKYKEECKDYMEPILPPDNPQNQPPCENPGPFGDCDVVVKEIVSTSK
jgi:tetratricopeptide (TPR) repeat protein